MLKKIILAASSATLLIAAVSASSAMQVSSMGGYFGANLGGDFSSTNTKFNTDISGNYSKYGLYVAGQHETSPALNGFLGGVFGGYGITYSNNFYLGTELYGQANSNKDHDNLYLNVGGSTASLPGVGAGVETKVGFDTQKLYSIGLSVLPGYKVNDNNLLYTRVGAVYSRFKGTPTAALAAAYNGGNIANIGIAIPTSGYNMGFLGAQVGLGYQLKLQKNLSLRAEYNYTQYQSKNADVVDLPVGSLTNAVSKNQFGANVNGSINIKPYTNDFKVGLVYDF